MIRTILDNLKNPDRKYRGIPFWSWNGKLDTGELRRQVRDMADAGFGGYFIHARAGLKTPYFGREWMECITACINEGRKAGIATWLYDENGYPSGFAGGAVPAMGIEYQQKHLCFEIRNAGEIKAQESTLALYRAGGAYERILNEPLRPDEPVLRAYYRLNPYYSDLLDAKVVKAFIDATYEPYYQQFGEFFGREIPGIFTDEPQYGRHGLPWSFILPDAFRERRGYDILECLPALYAKVPGYKKLRYDFWSAVAELFSENCAKQLADWCQAHGCMLTGHVLLEESMRLQTLCSGSAMGFYRHMHIPGIDWLGRETGDPVLVKQVASAAAQTGRDLVLSEMFAAGGWNTTLAELKHITEWQYALGVNLTCTHLYAYSLTGIRKKDHPPGISYQSNWWRQCRTFNDAFTRLSMLLSQGNSGEQLLVIHPLASGWTALDASCTESHANADLADLDDRFTALSLRLTEQHIDYHYGDEGILADMGQVDDGALTVGACRYRSVLIPTSTTLSAHTVELLTELAGSGGTVYAFGDYFPTMLDGEISPVLNTFKSQCTLLSGDLSDLTVLRDGRLGLVTVTNDSGDEEGAIYHRISHYPGGTALFLVNMALKPVETTVGVKGFSAISRIDLSDCTARPLSVDENGRTRLHYEPGQSWMLYCERTPGARPAPNPGEKTIINLQNSWQIASASPNILLMDTCRLSVEGGPWSEPMALVQMQKRMLELGRTAEIAMSFTIDCRTDLGSAPLALVVEDRDQYTITLNGETVDDTSGWWKDVSFAKVDVSSRIRPGMNTLILATTFHNSPELMAKLERARHFEAEMNMLSYDSEVDNIYLLGDFSVMTDQPVKPAANDSLWVTGPFYLDRPGTAGDRELTASGYPFFTGSVVLEQTVDIAEAFAGCLLKTDRPHCDYCTLIINGQPVQSLLWPPYEVEIGPYLKKGANRIGIELVSTDRNLFGPHHHPMGELLSVGPPHFTDVGGWNTSYSLVPLGPGSNMRIECTSK